MCALSILFIGSPSNVPTVEGMSATNPYNKRRESLERSVTKSRNFCQRRNPIADDDARGRRIVSRALKSDRTGHVRIPKTTFSFVYCVIYSRRFAGICHFSFHDPEFTAKIRCRLNVSRKRQAEGSFWMSKSKQVANCLQKMRMWQI